MTPDTDLAEGTTFGKYRLVRLLGRGGMGAVYEATHVDLKKRVAIKVLPKAVSTDPVVRARFEREGEVASRIRHPHVVDVTDVGTEDGIPYLVMEFLEGEDLGTLLDRDRPLSVERICEIMLPVCAAVGAAHDEGIIHRDLKPENVYLAHGKHDTTIPKLLDFGISKVAQALAGSNDLTKTSSLLGTPYYMSPEQVRGAKHIDSRTDVYALGVILYECATGERPFADDNLYNLLLTIVSSPVKPPRELVPSLPEAFEAVIMKAMARSLDERFANVYQLGKALLPFANETTRAIWTGTFEKATASVLQAAKVSETELPVADASSPSKPGSDLSPLKKNSERPPPSPKDRSVTPAEAAQTLPSDPPPPPRPRTISAAISEVGAGAPPTRPMSSQPPAPKRTALFVAIAVVVVAGIVFAVLRGNGSSNNQPSPPAPVVTASTSAAPAPVTSSFVKRASVTVKMPAGSVVKVDNQARTLEGDKLQLEGPLETAFFVTVQKPSGDILVTQKVYMANGFTVPAEIDATRAASATSTSPSSAPSTAPIAPAQGKPGKSAPSGTPSSPAPHPSSPAPGATNWDG